MSRNTFTEPQPHSASKQLACLESFNLSFRINILTIPIQKDLQLFICELKFYATLFFLIINKKKNYIGDDKTKKKGTACSTYHSSLVGDALNGKTFIKLNLKSLNIYFYLSDSDQKTCMFILLRFNYSLSPIWPITRNYIAPIPSIQLQFRIDFQNTIHHTVQYSSVVHCILDLILDLMCKIRC